MKKHLLLLAFAVVACRSSPSPKPARSTKAVTSGESVQARAERIARWDLGVRMFLEGEGEALRACYENELRRVEEAAVEGKYLNGEPVPSLAGGVLLVVPIELDGAVRAPRLEDNTLGNDNVSECLLQEAKRWNVPPPPIDEVVEVQIPLTFELEGT